MTSLTLTLHFPQGYIAHPYWESLQRLIDIQKESGMRRARTEKNRHQALTEYLAKIGMTEAEYSQLEQVAARPFYTVADEAEWSFGRNPVNGHDPNEIVIPPHQIDGMLAQGSDEARSSLRIADRGKIRSVIRSKPIYTGKTVADGVWRRFAVVTAGTGAKLSNQRGLRENPYIGQFDGELELDFDASFVKPDRVRQFVEYCGREIGIGASRKMRWGRFEVTGVLG